MKDYYTSFRTNMSRSPTDNTDNGPKRFPIVSIVSSLPAHIQIKKPEPTYRGCSKNAALHFCDGAHKTTAWPVREAVHACVSLGCELLAVYRGGRCAACIAVEGGDAKTFPELLS